MQPSKLGLPFEYQNYPKYFNALNTSKTTDKTNSIIEKCLRQNKHNKTETVLDLTCGTGSQVFFLTNLGYQCTGADFSPDLLAQARQKAAMEGQDICFVDGDMRTLKQGKFDAVISIFNAIGHLTKSDFTKTILNVGHNLKEGGIYVFDILNLAAMTDTAVAALACHTHSIVRESQILTSQCSTLDKESGCLTSYNSVMIQKNAEPPNTFTNTFSLQLYTPEELKEMLSKNGFEVVNQIGLNGKKLVANKSRSILTIARKIGSSSVPNR